MESPLRQRLAPQTYTTSRDTTSGHNRVVDQATPEGDRADQSQVKSGRRELAGVASMRRGV